MFAFGIVTMFTVAKSYNCIRIARCDRKQKKSPEKGSDPVSESVKFYPFEEKAMPKRMALPKMKKEHPVKTMVRCWFSLPTLLLGICGFFMAGAGFLGAVYPFGIAWFASASAADRRRSFLWLLFAAAGYYYFVPSQFAVYAVILAASFFCFLFYPVLGSKSQSYLVITVFTAVLVIRGLFLVFQGISDMLLVITLTESILAAGFSLILHRASEVWHLLGSMEKPGRGDILCIFIFAGGLLLGMDSFAVYSVSPANVVMCFLILSAAFIGGAGNGAATGAVLGVLPSLSALVSPAAIGMYAFSGLSAGVFRRFRRPGIIVGYLLGKILLSLYLLDTTLLSSSALETLIGAVLFLAIPNGILFRISEVFGLKTPAAKADTSSKSEEYALNRLKETGQSLSALKTAMNGVYQESSIQSGKNANGILEHISTKICNGCTLKGLCWKSDFDVTYKDLMRVFALADTNDGITTKDLPETFRRKCCHSKEMVTAVNCLYELFRKNEYWQRQVDASRTLAVSQMEHTARILTELAENMEGLKTMKETLYTKLGSELRKNGFRVDKIFFDNIDMNEIRLRLKTRHCDGKRPCGRQIAGAINHLSGLYYTVSDCCCGSRGEACVCRLISGDAISMEVSSVQLTKEGSTVCGDTDAALLLPDAKEALIISDGMGSGAKAKKESQNTVEFIRKILDCGFEQDFVAALARHRLLLEREAELYATLDLCLIDRIRKKAEFVKLGAGASYLCTPGKGVKVIGGIAFDGNTFFSAPAKRSKEPLNPGDILILASDGLEEAISAGNGPDEWLIPLLADCCGDTPKAIGERIANHAVLAGGGKVKDDITVTVAKVV